MHVGAARVRRQGRVEYDEGLRRRFLLEVGGVSTEEKDKKSSYREAGRFIVVWEGKEITV